MNRVPVDECVPVGVRRQLELQRGAGFARSDTTRVPTVPDVADTLNNVDGKLLSGVLLPSICLQSDESICSFLFGSTGIPDTLQADPECLRLYNYICIRLAAVQFVRRFLMSKQVRYSHTFLISCTRFSCLIEGLRDLFYLKYSEVQQLVDTIDKENEDMRAGRGDVDVCTVTVAGRWMVSAYAAFACFMRLVAESCRFHAKPTPVSLGPSNTARRVLNSCEDSAFMLSNDGAIILSHLLLHVPHLTLNELAV